MIKWQQVTLQLRPLRWFSLNDRSAHAPEIDVPVTIVDVIVIGEDTVIVWRRHEC